MDKLITNLDTNLGPVLREQLDSNFQKIQNGVASQADILNKQIVDMLGDVPLQDKNEVTQARIDNSGKSHLTLKGRLDDIQSTAESALTEERLTGVEVQSARTNTSGKTYPSLGDRINDEEASLINNMNAKISQISSVPETFANLAALQSTYPNGKTGLFVTADTGHKFIWVNGSWSDAGFYQAVGVADSSINPQALLTTNIPLDKSSKEYSALPGDTFVNYLFIPQEPLSISGVVNIRLKSKITTVSLYLLQKVNGRNYVVKDKVITNTTVDGWQTIKTNFYATGSGDEYIGIIGNTYFAQNFGKGVSEIHNPDTEATVFVADATNATFDLALYPTFESTSVVEKIEKIRSVGGIMPQQLLTSNVPNDKTKNLYPAYSDDTKIFILSRPIDTAGIVSLSFLSKKEEEIHFYLLKRSGNSFAVKDKVTTNTTVDGWQTIKSDFYATGSGDEYIGFIGKLFFTGNGKTESLHQSNADINATSFNLEYTNVGFEASVFPIIENSKLVEEIEGISNAVSSIDRRYPTFSTSDFKIPKYSEIDGPVGFVGRWFDKTIDGVQTKATIEDGSEFYFKVKNTTTINVNFVLNSTLGTPYFAYSIDGSDMVRQLVTNPLLPNVSTDEHIIRVVADGIDEYEAKWQEGNGIAFKDVTVDEGGVVTGILPKNRKIMFYGDSITSGFAVLGRPYAANVNSASSAYPFFASANLNSISYRVAFPSAGLTRGGTGGVPKMLGFIDKMTSALDTSYYEPDIVVMNMGTNDGSATSADFTTNLNTVLDRLTIKYSGTPIFVMVPFNQTRKAELTSAVSARSNMYLVETEGWNITTTDGTHPDVAGSRVAGQKLADAIISVLGKSYFIE